MIIWFLDCSDASVTKVKLSAEREKEMDNTDDMYDFISKYADEFGINPNSSSWMVTDSEDVYEVDF